MGTILFIIVFCSSAVSLVMFVAFLILSLTLNAQGSSRARRTGAFLAGAIGGTALIEAGVLFLWLRTFPADEMFFVWPLIIGLVPGFVSASAFFVTRGFRTSGSEAAAGSPR